MGRGTHPSGGSSASSSTKYSIAESSDPACASAPPSSDTAGGVTNASQEARLEFVFNCAIAQENAKPIYSVKFAPRSSIFVAVGGNVAYLYKIDPSTSRCSLKQAFVDDDVDEIFYCADWSMVPGNSPVLVVAGMRGVVKAIDVAANEVKCFLVGHGNDVNDLKVHPIDANIVFSASKDETIRMWNLATGASIAIFCGRFGHRDQVLSIDIHPLGTCFASASMDTSVKIWNLDNILLVDLIEKSYTEVGKDSPGQMFQMPEFSTKNVHNNYIDFVAWVGNALLTNAVCDKVALWMPDNSLYQGAPLLLRKYRIPGLNAWYVRFGISIPLDLFAIGNAKGKIYVCRLSEPLYGKEDDVLNTLIPPPPPPPLPPVSKSSAASPTASGDKSHPRSASKASKKAKAPSEEPMVASYSPAPPNAAVSSSTNRSHITLDFDSSSNRAYERPGSSSSTDNNNNSELDFPPFTHSLLSHPKCTGVIRHTTFSPDDRYLVASSDDGLLWVWNILKHNVTDL